MLSRAQGRPRPPSAAQDAPTRARGGLQALADGAASTATPCRAPSGPPLYAGSGDMTRVRESCRVFGAQDGVVAPVQWGKTPVRGANPRPEGHDGHVSEEASPGLTHGRTRLTPRPRTCERAAGLRTWVGVVDVPPGRVGNPGARPQLPGTFTTRRVPRRGVARDAGGRRPTGGTGGIGRPGRAPPRRLHHADSGAIATKTRRLANTICPGSPLPDQ